MSVIRSTIMGDPNVGLYGFATERYGVCGAKNKELEKALSVKFHVLPVYGTYLTALFAVGNSFGIIISRHAVENAQGLKKITKVMELDTSYTALGNLILLNDKGIVISPLLRKYKKPISDFFSLPCETGTVAGLTVVGSAAVATNNGCLVHPNIREKEKLLLEKVLGVNSFIGSVSFGSPFVKSGIIANSKGAVVSGRSSGVELGHIAEAFGF